MTDTKDATRKGVSQDDAAHAEAEEQNVAEAEVQTGPDGEDISDREAVLERIAQSARDVRDEEMAAEAGEVDDAGDDQEQQDDVDATDDQDDKQEKEVEGKKDDEDKKAEKTPVTLKDDDLVETVVNGKKVLKPWGEVKTATQKVYAADQKFNEAAKMRKEAQELTEAAKKNSTEQDDKPASSKQEGEEPDYKDLVNALQYGDVDEATDAIKTLLKNGNGRDTHSLSEEQIASRAAQLATEHIQHSQAYQRDLTTFASEFPEIAADTRLQQQAAGEVHSVRAEDLISIGYPEEDIQRMSLRDILEHHRYQQKQGAVRSEIDLFREAGTRTQQWIGNLRTPNTEQGAPSDTLEEKRELKRSMPNPPTAASQRVPARQEQKPPTRSDVIADMRQARGQA